jgi:hypothetical protein
MKWKTQNIWNFKKEESVKLVWEYIWLLYTMRSCTETEIEIFGSDIGLGKYQILLMHYDAFKCLSIEERPALFELFHHLILADGIKKKLTDNKAAKRNREVTTADSSTVVENIHSCGKRI